MDKPGSSWIPSVNPLTIYNMDLVPLKPTPSVQYLSCIWGEKDVLVLYRFKTKFSVQILLDLVILCLSMYTLYVGERSSGVRVQWKLILKKIVCFWRSVEADLNTKTHPPVIDKRWRVIRSTRKWQQQLNRVHLSISMVVVMRRGLERRALAQAATLFSVTHNAYGPFLREMNK